MFRYALTDRNTIVLVKYEGDKYAIVLTTTGEEKWIQTKELKPISELISPELIPVGVLMLILRGIQERGENDTFMVLRPGGVGRLIVGGNETQFDLVNHFKAFVASAIEQGAYDLIR